MSLIERISKLEANVLGHEQDIGRNNDEIRKKLQEIIEFIGMNEAQGTQPYSKGE